MKNAYVIVETLPYAIEEDVIAVFLDRTVAKEKLEQAGWIWNGDLPCYEQKGVWRYILAIPLDELEDE